MIWFTFVSKILLTDMVAFIRLGCSRYQFFSLNCTPPAAYRRSKICTFRCFFFSGGRTKPGLKWSGPAAILQQPITLTEGGERSRGHVDVRPSDISRCCCQTVFFPVSCDWLTGMGILFYPPAITATYPPLGRRITHDRKRRKKPQTAIVQ